MDGSVVYVCFDVDVAAASLACLCVKLTVSVSSCDKIKAVVQQEGSFSWLTSSTSGVSQFIVMAVA